MVKGEDMPMMKRNERGRPGLAAVAALLVLAPCFAAQSPSTKFEGMWSDPPADPEGQICMSWCSDAGVARLNELLDDPKNDSRSFNELWVQAMGHQQNVDIKPKLIGEAARRYPLKPLDDPSYLRCEPYGFIAQILSRHQLEIRRRDAASLELHYGEWDARRVVWLDGRKPAAGSPATRLGHSTGRFVGETLVIETTGISASQAFGAPHSDQVRVVEVYSRSADGKLLSLTATVTDPVSYSQPIVVKKLWGWAPQATIDPYKDCELPPEAAQGGKRS